MTSQIQDEIEYRAKRYAITAIEGVGMFDPSDHGVRPRMLSTACWRGYICTYRIEDDALLLSQVELGLPTDSQHAGLRLFGHEPSKNHGATMHSDAAFYELAEPIAFTGRLLLGADFVEGVYLNMGFSPAWLYHDVHEVTFTSGRLTDSTDHSTALAELRDRLGPQAARPHDGETVRAWVDRTFSRDFDYSWPTQPPPT